MFTLGTRASSIKELQVHGLQQGLRRRHDRHWARAGAVLVRGEMYAAAVSVAGQVFFGVSYVATMLLVLRETVTGQGTVGDVVLVLTLAVLVHQQVSVGWRCCRGSSVRLSVTPGCSGCAT